MKMAVDSIKKWIWQHVQYPDFQYDKTSLIDLLVKVEYNHGVLNGIVKAFNEEEIQNIELEALLNEAVNTSLIEGEYLQRESVRASLLKRLSSKYNRDKDSSTHQSDALAEVLIDCSMNRSILSVERLHGWHNSLFISGYSGLHKIKVAGFREHDDMEVVSGAIGREKVHYKAPPQDLIKSDVDALLKWIAASDENVYIKSALAHLWFVSIHPYDDGNGRIARAIADYILSGSEERHTDFKLYSLSTAIYEQRKAYYVMLDKTTNLFINRDFDFTSWVKWHLEIINQAMIDAQEEIEYLVEKTKFWDKHRTDSLNERQIKVLSKVLSMGKDNFKGGISTKKYMTMTKVSKATAIRDIQDLVEKGCIEQLEGTSGRNVRYQIQF
jgi:Fic family protein